MMLRHVPGSFMPTLALVLNALIFGVSWWPFRALQAQGVHPLWATAITFFLTLIGLTLVRPGAWCGLVRHRLLWLLLVASGLANVGFNWAVTTGDVVRAVLLFYLMPAWSLVLAWPVLGERPTTLSLLRLALALCGVLVVLKTPDSAWPVPGSLPDWLALLGGFCFALTNVLLRRLQHTPSDARMLAMFAGGAFMASGSAWVASWLGLASAPPVQIGAWVGLATALGLALLAGNLALQYGAARLPASATSIIMLTEVVFASVSSVLLGAGQLSLRIAIGGGLILAAALLAALPSTSKAADSAGI
jgi:drug/metabolite transporter (DMT)-like permease